LLNECVDDPIQDSIAVVNVSWHAVSQVSEEWQNLTPTESKPLNQLQKLSQFVKSLRSPVLVLQEFTLVLHWHTVQNVSTQLVIL